MRSLYTERASGNADFFFCKNFKKTLKISVAFSFRSGIIKIKIDERRTQDAKILYNSSPN